MKNFALVLKDVFVSTSNKDYMPIEISPKNPPEHLKAFHMLWCPHCHEKECLGMSGLVGNKILMKITCRQCGLSFSTEDTFRCDGWDLEYEKKKKEQEFLRDFINEYNRTEEVVVKELDNRDAKTKLLVQ